MDWSAEIEAQRQGLKRIVAMLFSLAVAAEFAAGRPLPALRYVLSILRPAAIYAWQRFGGLANPDPDAPSPRRGWELPGFLEIDANDGPDDALRLAASFRLLACALAWQLLRTECAAPCPVRHCLHKTLHRLPSAIRAARPPAAHRRDWLGPD